MDQSSDKEKNSIVYSLFCIFIIIVIITTTISIISSINISFVAIISCLYLNPWVSPFVHFSSPSCWGGREGVSKQLTSAQLPAAG